MDICQIVYFLNFLLFDLFLAILPNLQTLVAFTKQHTQQNLLPSLLFVAIFQLFSSKIVHALPDGNPAFICSRFPGGHDAETSEGDNGYYIEVRDASSKLVVSEFIPSKKYEVTITTTRDPFKGFALVAVDQNVDFNEEKETAYMGVFEAMNKETTQFPKDCPRMATHKNAENKMSVTLIWYAPENTFDRPCVHFRATVVKTKKEFYMDAGNLTKRFCKEMSAADYLATNPQIRQCCACGRANYRINFEATWDQKTDINGKTPFDYISPKWQSLIGASHDEIFSLWRYDEVAPEHMKQDVSLNAGKIQPQKTQDFLKENFRSVRTVIRMPDIPDAKGEASAQFSVDENFHLASFLAFLSPSPDWFVGFNSVDLCDVECVWKENIRLNLYPIDAGTHSGDNFMAAREPLVQRQKIQDLRYLNRNNSNSPFYEEVRNSIPKFATVELIRTAVRDDACQSSNYNPAFSSNQGDDGVRPNQVPYEEVSPGCHMTFWTEWDWSRCREDCKRNAIRNRQFVSNVAKCATHELIQFGSCSGAVKGCPKNTESPNKY